MPNVNKLKGHRSSTFHGIKISTGWTEATMATKRNKFEFAAFGATKQGTAKTRVATI